MRWGKRIGLFCLCVFIFQNCSTFDANIDGLIYKYQSKPDFFYDVKLVSVSKDEFGRESHVFDVAISFASNINQEVSYQLAFSTFLRTGICETRDASAIGDGKHARFTCILATPDDLYLQLTLLGPTGEEVVEVFRY